MTRAAAALALALLFAQCGRVSAQQRTLALPHALAAGDTAYLEVQVGAIGPGQEIEIATTGGRTLGVISPHGIRAGHAAGVYTLPLPADAICHGGVAVALMITRPHPARAVRIVVVEASTSPR